MDKPDTTRRQLLSRLPILLFVFSLCIVSSVYGMALVKFKWYPAEHINNLYLSLKEFRINPNAEQYLVDFTETTVKDMGARFEVMLEGGRENTLWQGGSELFLDVCPEDGCIAVMFGRDGEAVRAWPLRVDELEAFLSLDEEWSEGLPFLAGASRKFTQFGTAASSVVPYEGDLIVSLHGHNSFLAEQAIVRIDSDGLPVWGHTDWGTHHWMTFVESEGVIYHPGQMAIDPGTIGQLNHHCDSGSLRKDVVRVFDPADGRLIETIDVFQSMLDSPHFRHIVRHSLPCYPLHLNYVDVLREDVHGIPGAKPGDLVVSLRGPSAFVILDRDTHEVIRMVRGTFLGQHSVQHLRGSQFILFDNIGGASSRVMVVDLANGEEKVVFPTKDTPAEFHLNSNIKGALSVSDDRSRVIATFSLSGIALELRIADGEILNVFRNLHDVSSSELFADYPERETHATLMESSGVWYAD